MIIVIRITNFLYEPEDPHKKKHVRKSNHVGHIYFKSLFFFKKYILNL